MNRFFDVMYQEKTVGTVEVSTVGLYYRIRCRVRLPGLRLQLKTSETVLDFGICVCLGTEYGLDIKRPVKSVTGNIEGFFLSKQKRKALRHLIDPSKPFFHLQMLSAGVLEIEDGKYYWQCKTIS